MLLTLSIIIIISLVIVMIIVVLVVSLNKLKLKHAVKGETNFLNDNLNQFEYHNHSAFQFLRLEQKISEA